LNVYQALYGKAPSYALFADYKATVSSSSTATFAQQLASGFKSLTGPEFANLVLSNLGINDPVLATAFGQLLDGYGLASRGQILVNMTSLLAGLENDAKYGAVAKSFNAATDANFAYASSPANTVPSSPNTITADPTYTITTSPDTASANKFTSIPAYTPGGNNFVNTLQDEDTLTGVGTNPTLSVILGSVNDAAENNIVPKLLNIQTVNVESTGSTAGINFQDSTALVNLSVNRITQNNAFLTLSDLPATANAFNLNNATRAGVVTFATKEEVLTGPAETLAVGVNNARVSALSLTEGTDGGADAGYYFETVNVTTTGNNDLDAVTVQQNGMEDTLLSLTAGTTKQTLNVVANGGATSSLEINNLTATGVEFMTVAANARVDIAANKMLALAASNDGITTPDLETLTITGASNVMIDGLDTTKLATKTLTVSAGTMTGNLSLGVATASDASSSATYATRTDKDLSVTSGSGDDTIVTYTTLAGDITTNGGKDTVRVGNASTAAASLDAEGVSTISTGDGNDVVVAKDLLVTASDKDQTGNESYTVTGATINTGAGDDVVTVGALTSGADWDNRGILDGNLNDQQVIRGAAISAGDGSDTITFTTAAEGTLVDAGAGDDTVTVTLGATATILAPDTNPDVVSVVTATVGMSNATTTYTDEVVAMGVSAVADRLGAVVDLGAGANDVINFREADTGIADSVGGVPTETSQSAYTLVARDAELRGAETLNVSALDAVTVTTATTTVDQDTTATGVQSDLNANIIGTVTANFTVLNQVEDTDTADTTVAHNTVAGSTVNDNNATDGAITANVMRFDSALTNINLVSQEQVMQTGPATEIYEAGTKTTFTLNNLREGVALSLTANEATGVSSGALADDTLLAISTSTLLITRAAAEDVTLNLDYDSARGLTNAGVLNVTAASGAIDLDLNIGATTTDTLDTDGDGNSATVANAASTTDDDTMRIENFTVNFADSNSHSVDANAFGDNVFRATRPPVATDDVSSTAVTSFTINSGAGAGSGIQLAEVNTDVIAFNNAAGTAVTAANVTLTVDQSNNYTITTGSGTDIIDMRADDVRSDDILTAVDRADRINAGDGRDTMIINGNDSLGTNDNAGVSASTIVNDDVFMYLDSIETILIGTKSGAGYYGANGGLAITIDEQAGTGAGNTNVDTIRMIGDQANRLDLVVGNNFTIASTVNTTNIAGGALLISTQLNTAATVLNIENKDDDSDIQVVNMDIQVGSVAGTILNIVNSGSQLGQVEVRAFSPGENTTFTVSDSIAGTSAGQVKLNAIPAAVAAFDKLVLVEGSTANNVNSVGAGYGSEGAVTINIEGGWTNDSTGFTLDASALLNTDDDPTTAATVEGLATGGATITVDSGDLAALTVSGTQNNDTITTGRGADVVNGNNGDDTIVGDEVTNNAELEVVTFAATYDSGDVVTVTHNGISITATIGADGVTGTAVAAALAGATNVAGAATDANGADNIVVGGNFLTGATSVAAAANLRLSGAAVGTDYVVSAATNNAGDNIAQVQTLTVGADAAAVSLVFNGVTYAIADSTAALDTAYVALGVAVTALGGTLTSTGQGSGANDVFIITGPSTGAAFPFITQTSAGALTVTAADLGTDQANPTIATETLARSVIGGADTINGGNGDDNITGLVGADVLDGGAGNDTVNYQLSLAAVNVNLTTNVVSGGDAQGDVISNFESIIGTVYADALVGSSVSNTIDGGAGNDTISTLDGADAITAGLGADTVNGGNGIDIITLTEATSSVDRVVSDATVLANADRIVGFDTTVDKFLYTGVLQNALGTNSDGVSGTDVVTGVATMTLAMANAASTAGVVFDISGLNISGTTSDALFAAVTAADISTAFAAFKTAAIASGALSGTITNLDAVLNTTDSVLVVLHDSTGGTATTAGSIVLRITNTSTAVADTLIASEVELVGVFANSQLAAIDFI